MTWTRVDRSGDSLGARGGVRISEYFVYIPSSRDRRILHVLDPRDDNSGAFLNSRSRDSVIVWQLSHFFSRDMSYRVVLYVSILSVNVLDFVHRWGELIRKIELWTEIHELNEQGDYVPVEVIPKQEALTGGIFQLRQGHSRRILVYVKPVQNSGTNMVICGHFLWGSMLRQ